MLELMFMSKAALQEQNSSLLKLPLRLAPRMSSVSLRKMCGVFSAKKRLELDNQFKATLCNYLLCYLTSFLTS